MTQLDTVGQRLRYARTCRGYSKRLVGKYMSVNVSTLKGYEMGQRLWPVELARLLAYVYDVPQAWVIEGEGNVPCKPMSFVDKRLDDPEARLRKRWRTHPSVNRLARGDG